VTTVNTDHIARKHSDGNTLSRYEIEVPVHKIPNTDVVRNDYLDSDRKGGDR